MPGSAQFRSYDIGQECTANFIEQSAVAATDIQHTANRVRVVSQRAQDRVSRPHQPLNKSELMVETLPNMLRNLRVIHDFRSKRTLHGRNEIVAPS